VRVELGTIPPAFGHAGKLEQVLVNLIVNAAQALSPDREAQNEILVRAFAPDPRHVAIEITDNGAGIPPGLVNRVFDPFFTTKPDGEGTGLGLFISHNHVRQMEGELVLESVPGRTTMRVVLRAAEARDPQLVPEHTAPRARARGRVLIVDDEPTMCRSLQILLRDDYDTTVALGGAEALELIERGDSFDLILCDLMMPGVTGMDLFSQLEQKRPGLEKRMIFMTGGAFTDEARAFLSRCPNLRLQKPFAAEALETALQQVLQLSAREPSR
jgi:CheY-like chemotaxis protein/anti-sigma regulatory factor (Ser/Thr protein kinase)